MQSKDFKFRVVEDHKGITPLFSLIIVVFTVSSAFQSKGNLVEILVLLAVIIAIALFLVFVYQFKVRFEFDDKNFVISSYYGLVTCANIECKRYIVRKLKTWGAKPMLVAEVWMNKYLFTFVEDITVAKMAGLETFETTNLPVHFRCLKSGIIDEIAAMIDEFNSRKEG